MDRNSSRYTFTFAFIVCVACSFALSLVSEALKTQKERNVFLDIQKNILKAVNLQEALGQKPKAADVERVFKEKIKEAVIDTQGNIVEGKRPTDPDVLADSALLPLYIYEEGGQPMAYAFPIVGKGLWSTLRGYFAIEPDGATVRGITFYEHGETPGLGAEIEKKWFQDNYKGKKIWDVKAGELRPVGVIKGKVATAVPSQDDQLFYVDGISGATITSNGVTSMVDKWVKVYEPFFSKIRKL